jgi:F-type H+-transporting ATPase subunit b
MGAIEPNIWRVIITIINFFILYAILRHFLFNPITNLIDSRQKEIQNNIKTAEEDKTSARKNIVEAEAQLKDSKQKGKEIIENFKAKAQLLSDDIINSAKEEAQAIMERAVKETEREKEKAEDELKKQTVELAILLSSKALERTIDEDEHRRLISDFITKVGT